MRKLINTLSLPPVASHFFDTNVLVKAVLCLINVDEVKEVVLRLWMVHDYDFKTSVKMVNGKRATFGTNFIEIRSTCIGPVCSRDNDFVCPWSGQNIVRRKTILEGQFLTVLREKDHFVRGERVSIEALNTAMNRLRDINSLLRANGRPQTIKGMREIVETLDNLPVNWQKTLEEVLDK